MIDQINTTIRVPEEAAIERLTDIRLARVTFSLFVGGKAAEGMAAGIGSWRAFSEAVRSLLAVPYVAGLFFVAGNNRAVEGVFPRTTGVCRLVELMGRTAVLPQCRRIACQFPGLLSTCDPARACSCPLSAECGVARVDTIRLESRGVLFGDLMLFSEAGTPLGQDASDGVTAAVHAFSDSLLALVNQNEGLEAKP